MATFVTFYSDPPSDRSKSDTSDESGKIEANNSEDEYEDWCYGSIKRYAHLCMYDLPIPSPQRIAFSPSGKVLAVAGVDGRMLRVCAMRVPQKLLTTDPVAEGFINSRELNVIGSGAIELEEDEDSVRSLEFFRLQGPADQDQDDTLAVITRREVTHWVIDDDSDQMRHLSSFRMPLQRLAHNLPKMFRYDLHGFAYMDGDEVVFTHLSTDEYRRVKMSANEYVSDVSMYGFPTMQEDVQWITVVHETGQDVHVKHYPGMEGGSLPKPSPGPLGTPRLCPNPKMEDFTRVAGVCQGKLTVFSYDNEMVSTLDDGDRRVLSIFPWAVPDTLLTLDEETERVVTVVGMADTRVLVGGHRVLFRHDGHRAKVVDARMNPHRERMGMSLDVDGKLHLWVYEEIQPDSQ